GPRVATSRRGWSTPFGVVAADPAWIDWLVAEGLAAEDDAALAPEHSVGGLMPYIAYHLPGARVVPIILHRGVTVAEARRLAGALATRIGPGAVLIGSVDFSHYLPRAEAAARDRETLAAIGCRDWDTLLAMGNDHLDSPATVAVVFMAMAAAGAGEPELVAHANSGDLVGSDGVETTSYLVFQFRRVLR
ncbi:MAG: AmmeMemoRadiSam system protein B, partial [Bacillota bacterium]